LEPDRHARTTRRRATAFTVEHQIVGQRTVLLVGGDLDAIHAPELARAVHRALATRPEQLVIDVCHVAVVDYRGLAVLLNAHRRARRLGVKLSLACDVPSTRSLFERMRLDRYFDIHTTDGLSLAHDTRA
jgi:anti-anti-sigma factor